MSAMHVQTDCSPVQRAVRLKTLVAWAIALGVLAGCAAYNPVPENYVGPVAIVADSGVQEDGTKARVFALVEVDGQRIENTFGATAKANQGRGFSLAPVFMARRVPIRPMKVKLRASHMTGAPIHALFSQAAGTFFSTEGEVEFTPTGGARYVVRGELKANGSSVWIEDAETGQPVTRKVP